MNPSKHQLVRILCQGLNDIEEWRLGNAELAAAKGYPRAYPADLIDDWGILFADFVLEAGTGTPICHEVNGPNAVGSDALTGDSALRAEGEARQTLRRVRELGWLGADGWLKQPVVTLHAHQHWRSFRTGGEFYPRVDQFAELLSQLLPNQDVCLRGGLDSLGTEAVAVVVGDVPSVAAGLELNRAARRFEYRGRPVVFIGNPNLLPELIRTRKLHPEEPQKLTRELRVFHAARLLPIILDKGQQQLLLAGTGVRPLRWFAAHTFDEALQRTRAFLAQGPVVLKPNATSGGTGVHVVAPGMTDQEIEQRLTAVVGDCVTKYGENAQATAFPLRGFEFIRSTGYPMADGEHLWDLRIGILLEPGQAKVFPVSLRLAPDPFDERTFHQGRDQWVSNVSGRQVTLLKSGMDDEVLQVIGMTDAKLDQVFAACVRWTMKAWDAASRDGGPMGNVYEDHCEQRDPTFYTTDKFRSG